jgi:hypothetical protein
MHIPSFIGSTVSKENRSDARLYTARLYACGRYEVYEGT